MKGTLVRDGATTVEAVLMTFMHTDCDVVTIHGDDFIAAGSQQGLDSLNHTMETLRTKPLGRIGTVARGAASSSEGQWSSLMVQFAWQECIEELGLARGKAPSTRHDGTVKNLAEAEDSLSEVVRGTSRGWQARCSTTAWMTQRFSSRWPE